MADNFEVVFEKQVESGRTTNQNRPRIFKLTVIFYNFFFAVTVYCRSQLPPAIGNGKNYKIAAATATATAPADITNSWVVELT